MASPCVLKIWDKDGKGVRIDHFVEELDQEVRGFASNVGAPLPEEYGK
jgi:hypothetical protein